MADVLSYESGPFPCDWWILELLASWSIWLNWNGNPSTFWLDYFNGKILSKKSLLTFLLEKLSFCCFWLLKISNICCQHQGQPHQSSPFSVSLCLKCWLEFLKNVKFTYNSFYNFPQVTKMKCKKLDHNFSAFSGGWGSSGVSHSHGDSIYRWIQSQSSARGSINDIDYQQFLDDLFPKSWHININPLSGAAAASPACHQNGQKFNIKDTLENWLAFYINLLDKVDILRETSYKFVVFGTAAKNLKEYRLWNTIHFTLPLLIELRSFIVKFFKIIPRLLHMNMFYDDFFFLYLQIKSWYVLIIEYNTQNIPQNEWRMEM